MKTQVRWFVAGAVLLTAAFSLLGGCKEEDGPVAPYAGAGAMATVKVQDSVFTPKVTWLGGYVSIVGVNRGTVAKLDSSLVWLVFQAGNSIHYPVTFGQIPQGAQDLAANYGGHSLLHLKEDEVYTFWVMKEDAWNLVSGQPNKPLIIDSLTTSLVTPRNDTLLVSARSYSNRVRAVDVYINVKDLTAYGRLVTDPATQKALITITASDTCNRPVVRFTVKQQGVRDTMIAAIGVCVGGEYKVQNRVWEMISKDVRPDTVILWKNNVIASPIQMGQSVSNTETFVTYPPEGLQRGVSYYLWMASKDWDQKGRIRSTQFYAYATFTVW
jgi:hypothetical protein